MSGLIRKIIVGQNPKNAMAYVVGMEAGRSSMSISAIVFDEEHLVRYNKSRYLIYVKEEDGVQTLWKYVEEMPVIIEYDLNF